MSRHRMQQQGNADRAVLGKRETGAHDAETGPPVLRHHRASGSYCSFAQEDACGPDAAHYHLPTPATPHGGPEASRACGMPERGPLSCRQKRTQPRPGRRASSARSSRTAGRDKGCPSGTCRGQDPQTRRSQHKYLQNINIRDKWLKMAVVSQALSWACSVEESASSSYSMELKKFEHFDLFTLVFASSYLKRVITAQVLGLSTFLKLFLVCNIIALKYQEDYNTMNCRYSEDWGVQLENINAIEAEVLMRLNYDLTMRYSEIVSVLDERIYCLKRLRLR